MHWIWTLVSALTLGRVGIRGPKGAPAGPARLYITFDDGPHPQYTPALLELLAQHRAKATFFVVGHDAQQHPEVLQRLLAEGHTLANHSMTHARLTRLAPAAQVQQITQAEAALGQTAHSELPLFRPAHGRPTALILGWCLAKGRRIMLWSVDSLDFSLSATAVVSRLQRTTLRDGDILLFHDDGETSALALAELLPLWRKQGFELAAL